MPGPWRSWTKSLSCKSQKEEKVHSPVPRGISAAAVSSKALRGSSGCSRSLSNLKDVIHGNTKVVHKSASCSPQLMKHPDYDSGDSRLIFSSSDSAANASFRHFEGDYHGIGLFRPGTPKPQPKYASSVGAQKVSAPPNLRKFGGCNGCNVADEAFGAIIFHRDAYHSRSLCRYPQPTCQKCGESFSKYEALEHHHAVRHAVTELSRGDSSRNIVEIIFRTSWLKKEAPCGKIERILKVNNNQKTIAKFEEYRDQVKTRANCLPKKHARCIADGNELLRFHATNILCNLGADGSSSICQSAACNVCRVIKSGFSSKKDGHRNRGGIHTTATSGRAHDSLRITTYDNNNEDDSHLLQDGSYDQEEEQQQLHAMLVCRVIAGRMHRGYTVNDNNLSGNGEEVSCPPSGFDSMAGELGPFSNVDDLYVFNSRAVLPCFVVIYRWK